MLKEMETHGEIERHVKCKALQSHQQDRSKNITTQKVAATKLKEGILCQGMWGLKGSLGPECLIAMASNLRAMASNLIDLWAIGK